MTWSIPHNTTTEPVQIWKVIIAAILLLHACICLIVIQPQYYIRRNNEYFKHRSPGWVTVFNVYCCVSMICIAAQELLVSAGSHWPCIITWALNTTNICLLSVPATIRGWSVAVKFTPALRKTPARRFLNSAGQWQLMRTMLMICVPFYIAMLFAFPYYMDTAGDRQCSINGEWYFYILYASYALHRSKKLKHCMTGVDDYYQIGHEVRLGFSAQTALMVYYILEMILFAVQYGGVISRGEIEHYAIPLDYMIYALYAVRVHATSTQTIYRYKQWRARHHQRRHSTSTTSKSSRTTEIRPSMTASSNVNFDQVGDDEHLTLYNNMEITQTPQTTYHTLLKGNGKHSKRWNLLRVLNTDDLRAAFTVHANKSLCGEMMVFYNEMHAFRQKMHQARQLCMADANTLAMPDVIDPNRYGVSTEEIRTFGCALFDKYISVGSEYELNVNATLRQQFDSVIGDIKGTTLEQPSKVKRDNSVMAIAICETDDQRTDALWQLCNATQKEIYNLLNTNLFKSFQTTNVYKSAVAEAAEATPGEHAGVQKEVMIAVG